MSFLEQPKEFVLKFPASKEGKHKRALFGSLSTLG